MPLLSTRHRYPSQGSNGEARPREESFVDRALHGSSWLQRDLPPNRHGVPFDDCFRSEVQSTADHHEHRLRRARRSRAEPPITTIGSRRFHPRPSGSCEGCADGRRRHGSASQRSRRSSRRCSRDFPDPLAAFLARFPDALATLLAGFAGSQRKSSSGRGLGLRPGRRHGQQHEKRGNPSSHSDHSLAGSDGASPGEVPPEGRRLRDRHDHRDAHAAADAQRGNAPVRRRGREARR